MDDVDLPAYFRRIGFTGTPRADRATLDELIALHRSAIAFENVDGLSGRVPGLDLASLQAKLVARRRGGWCFEQNRLFLAVLRGIGFQADGLESRVRFGRDPAVDSARTHMLVRVVTDGVALLADVGFGGPSPLASIAIDDRDAQRAGADTYRLVDIVHGGEAAWMVQGRVDDQWLDIYLVHPRVASPIDYELANWWVSTSPLPPLRNNLIVSRPRRDGTRVALRNDQLTTRPPGGVPTVRQLRGRAEFAETLAEVFGLDITDGELSAALAVVDRASAAAAAATP